MTISSLSSLSSLLNSSSSALTGSGSSLYGTSTDTTGSATSVSPTVVRALTEASTRLQADYSSTTAQLSSFGLLKSALATSQSSAQALINLPSSASASDVTTAMANFFNGYNSAIKAAANSAAVPGTGSAAANAKRVSKDMQWALSTNSNAIGAMQTLGLTLQSDGTLKQDATQFANAEKTNPAGVQSAMAILGKAIANVTTKELGSTGFVGSTITSLTQHNTSLTAQQNALQSLEQTLGITDPNSSSSSSNTASGGTNSTTGNASTANTYSVASLLAQTSLNNNVLTGLAAYQSLGSGY